MSYYACLTGRLLSYKTNGIVDRCTRNQRFLLRAKPIWKILNLTTLAVIFESRSDLEVILKWEQLNIQLPWSPWQVYAFNFELNLGNPGCPPMVGSPPHGTLCKILKGPPLHLIGDTWGCQENVNIDLYPRWRGLYETFCWLRQRLVRKAIIGNSLLCQLQLALTSASAANHCYSILLSIGQYWSVLVSIGQYWSVLGECWNG